MTTVSPIRDRILVKPLEADTVTASGIVIPDNAKEKPTQGIVVAAGAGKISADGKLVPTVVKAGDKVLYPKLAGQPVKVDNEEHIFLNEDEILAIVE
jgi:chaperonin GroES